MPLRDMPVDGFMCDVKRPVAEPVDVLGRVLPRKDGTRLVVVGHVRRSPNRCGLSDLWCFHRPSLGVSIRQKG